jgi:hypothetical protein
MHKIRIADAIRCFDLDVRALGVRRIRQPGKRGRHSSAQSHDAKLAPRQLAATLRKILHIIQSAHTKPPVVNDAVGS